MKIVGHRGVRNSYTENTLKAIQKAIEQGVDAVECDVRLSKDKVPVICHNANLKQIYGVDCLVNELSFNELKKLRSQTNDTIPTLNEVFDLEFTKPIILDIKDHGSAKIIKKIVDEKKIKVNEWLVTTFLHDEAQKFKDLFPDLKIMLGSYSRPFSTIEKASQIGAYGVTFNLINLNIFSYKKARQNNLEIFLYQNYLPWLLTKPWSVKWIKKFYPNIIICTDQPDKILSVI